MRRFFRRARESFVLEERNASYVSLRCKVQRLILNERFLSIKEQTIRLMLNVYFDLEQM